MQAFHTMAVPHDDIIKRRLTMDVFAADLWNTFQKRGPEEYTDTEVFFKKTRMTKNLENLLSAIRKRLEGKGGDSFQHIETPFGGGKTHALIAMYHSAIKWDAKPVVIVGTAMSKDDTPWGMIEKQLDGKVDRLAGPLAPGREKIREVLSKHGSALILIDELLTYITTAAGVRIEETTLASQTITFIQQLSEEVASLDKVCVVASFPASVVEMADKELAEELLQKIRKVSGRKERKVTPIDPNDVPDIIRTRLFSTSEEDIKVNAGKVISEFVEYCEKESILPPNKTAKQYKEEFEHTYPFLPQVIDMLYHNWGSFTTFQRTRGVLRLLSLVVHSLKNSSRPYITLADFDLKDNEIRRELLVHIGDKFDSVISKDITDSNSGARKVEQEMKSDTIGLQLGTKAATSVFMSSFTSGGSGGATMNQIKRDVSNVDMHSAMIDSVVMNFKSRLSFIKSEDDRYLFSNIPNINRLKLDKMESVTDKEIEENEKSLLESNIGGQKLHSRIWPSHKDIDDSPTLKLIIMKEDNLELCKEIMENKGSVPRIYRNTLLFLCPSEAERGNFVDDLKSMIALKKIRGDRNLEPDQKKDVDEDLRKVEAQLQHQVRKYYRTLRIPSDNLAAIDMGVPTVGMTRGISDDVYDTLNSEQQIHERIGPMTLENEYLKNQKFAHTATMYESMLKTPGSRRPTSQSVVLEGLVRGIRDGIFGIGRLENQTPVCMHFKTNTASPEFSSDEIIIHKSMCQTMQPTPIPEQFGPDTESVDPKPDTTSDPKVKELIRQLDFTFDIPEGKMSEILGTLRLINEKFNSINIHIEAKDGAISNKDIDKIREGLRQINSQFNL